MTRWTYLILVITLLLLTNRGKAQKRNTESFDILYGAKLFNNNFYNQFNTINNYSYNSPVQMIGIGYSGGFAFTRSSWLDFDGHLSYAQIVPHQLTINDSIKCNINGFVFSASLFGWDFFPKSKYFHLLFSGGFNTGRLRLGGNEWVRQKNPFFSPKLSLQPKIVIGKIILSVRADYEWDISSKNWRRTVFATKDKINLDSFKMDGTTVFFCFGFVLSD